MGRLLARLDEGVARFERVVVLVFLSVMSLVVFLDVAYRVSATPDGLILKLLLLFAGSDPSAQTVDTAGRVGVPAVGALCAFGFYYAAFRTASGSTVTAGRGLLYALVSTLATGGAMLLLHAVFPYGLVWSQELALSLMLWVALLGASLATKARGHIALAVAQKLWPVKALPYVRLASGVIAAVFCFLLLILSVHFAWDFFEQWREYDVGYLAGIGIPKWTVYLALPMSFLVMGLRFIAYSIGDYIRGDVPDVGVRA